MTRMPTGTALSSARNVGVCSPPEVVPGFTTPSR